MQRLVVERDVRAQRVVVARHRHEQPERRPQCVADLPRAVGAEVEEHERIALRDAQLGVAEHDGLHELVGEAGRVARPRRRPTPTSRAPRRRRPSPRARSSVRSSAVIAVHGVVAPDDGRDRRARARPLPLELREQAGRLVRRDVAAVRERVHRDARHAGGERRSDDRAQVVDVRVHAAVGDEPGHVQHAAARRARPPKAACSAGLRASVPSATASPTRTRSWATMRPAPRLRCPTSELPIWPSGSPTARPDAISEVCG